MLLGNWTGGLKSGLPMIGPPKIFNLVQSSTSRTVPARITSRAHAKWWTILMPHRVHKIVGSLYRFRQVHLTRMHHLSPHNQSPPPPARAHTTARTLNTNCGRDKLLCAARTAAAAACVTSSLCGCHAECGNVCLAPLFLRVRDTLPPPHHPHHHHHHTHTQSQPNSIP